MQGTALKFYYDNILSSTGSTISATSTATGDYSLSYIHNMLEVNRWKGSSSATQNITYDAGAGNTKDADYLILQGHNLTGIGALVLYYSTTGAFAGEQITVWSTTISADTVFKKEFTSVGAFRYWRVGILSPTTAPYVAIASLGTATELAKIQPPFDPYGEVTDAEINMSSGGYVTGVHTRSIERQLEINLSNSSTALYAKVKAWRDTNGLKNFFMAWDSTGSPSDVWLVRPDTSFRNPINVNKLRDVSISLRGRKE